MNPEGWFEIVYDEQLAEFRILSHLQQTSISVETMQRHLKELNNVVLDTNISKVIHETEYITCNFDNSLSDEEQEELARMQAEEEEYWEMYMEQQMSGQYDYEDECDELIPDTIEELNALLDEQLK